LGAIDAADVARTAYVRDLELRAKARVTADADQDAAEIQRVYARKKAVLQE